MGLFGKKKTPKEILAEGQAYYQQEKYGKAALVLLKASGKENGEVDYWLGRCYLAFDGDSSGNRKTAKSFLTYAARDGHEEAAKLLAEQFDVKDYLPEESVVTAEEAFDKGLRAYNSKSYPEALQWWEKAAKLGEVSAQYNIAFMYHSGEGAEKDETKALYWYREAAKGGHPDAQFNTGLYYLHGVATSVDKDEALKWFQLAAQQGQEDAQKQLTELMPAPDPKTKSELKPTPGPIVSDEELLDRAMELFKKGDQKKAFDIWLSLAEKGNACAQNCAAVSYQKGEGVEADIERAIFWFEKSAAQGYGKACGNLARHYYDGDGVEQSYEKAVRLYEKAAEQGSRVSQYRLGCCYCYGEGVEQNYTKARKWFSAAAEAGHMRAATYYANLCELGYGGNQDYPEAVKWYRTAAENGDEDGMYGLAVCYANGTGIEADYEESLIWANKARESGHQKAAELVSALLTHIQEANKAESAFLKKEELQESERDRLILQAEAPAKPESKAEPESEPKQLDSWKPFVREAKRLWGRRKYDDAIEKYHEAIKLGWEDSETALEIGKYYDEESTEKRAGFYATRWYERGAKWGDSECCRLLGLRYLVNKRDYWLVGKDQDKALAYLRAAAKGGNTTAQYELGVLLTGGELEQEEVFWSKRVKNHLEIDAAIGGYFGRSGSKSIRLGLECEVTEEERRSGIAWMASLLLQENQSALNYCKKSGISREEVCSLFSKATTSCIIDMTRGKMLTAVIDGEPVFIIGVKDCIGKKRVWGYWKIDYIALPSGEEKQGVVCHDGKSNILYKDYDSLPQSLHSCHLIHVIEPCEYQAECRTIQYLYFENEQHYFMDLETFDQYGITEERFAYLNRRRNGEEFWNIQEEDIFDAYIVEGAPVFLREKK